jgi:hypothetical protein
MCFVWISEQTAIIFLYSINRLVFVTEWESVYCAVRTGSLYIKQIRFVFKGLICIYVSLFMKFVCILSSRFQSTHSCPYANPGFCRKRSTVFSNCPWDLLLPVATVLPDEKWILLIWIVSPMVLWLFWDEYVVFRRIVCLWLLSVY